MVMLNVLKYYPVLFSQLLGALQEYFLCYGLIYHKLL